MNCIVTKKEYTRKLNTVIKRPATNALDPAGLIASGACRSILEIVVANSNELMPLADKKAMVELRSISLLKEDD